jgi:methylphosphotriester-DNA--protein-cysteine methyltransferase
MIAPEPSLARRVNTFYVIETEAGRVEEIIPAYSAQLVLAVRGKLAISYADGSVGRPGTITINAPQLRAAACVIEGPALLIGASLTPIGWQALANRAVDEVHDQLLPAEDMLTGEQIAQLHKAVAAGLAGEAAPAELCASLDAVMAAAPFEQRDDHVAAVEAITAWLASGFDPPLSDLHAAIAISPRQLQRIARRYFGVPPAQVLKRSRAIRAAMLLANPALPESMRTEMLTTYFDQAHLIRDIRRFTGRTPTQLRAESLSTGTLDPAGHGDAAAMLRAAAA